MDLVGKNTMAIHTWVQQASAVTQDLLTEGFFKFSVPCSIHADQSRSFKISWVHQLCCKTLYYIPPLEKQQTATLSTSIISYAHCQHPGNGTGPPVLWQVECLFYLLQRVMIFWHLDHSAALSGTILRLASAAQMCILISSWGKRAPCLYHYPCLVWI